MVYRHFIALNGDCLPVDPSVSPKLGEPVYVDLSAPQL